MNAWRSASDIGELRVASITPGRVTRCAGVVWRRRSDFLDDDT
jgi:hypothetical protein